MYKVLFHLNDPTKVGDVLRNIENLLNDLKDNELKIKLVIHAQGILPFTEANNPNTENVNGLLERNVEFAICSNTMKNLHLKKEDFPFDIVIVSSAMGEIVRSQKDGWLYIKP